MYTLSPYPQGSEVFNHYNELPNSQLLVRFGFALLGNDLDAVNLSLPGPSEDSAQPGDRARARILRHRGLKLSHELRRGTFDAAGRDDGGPAVGGILDTVRVLYLADGAAAAYLAAHGDADAADAPPLGRLVGPAASAQAASALLGALRGLAARYDGSAAADAAALAAAPPAGEALSGARRNVAVVRSGERAILAANVAALERLQRGWADEAAAAAGAAAVIL